MLLEVLEVLFRSHSSDFGVKEGNVYDHVFLISDFYQLISHVTPETLSKYFITLSIYSIKWKWK